MDLNAQAAKLAELRDAIIALADKDGELSEDEATRYAELNTEFEELRAQHDADFATAAEFAERDAAVRGFEARTFEHSDGARAAKESPAFHREVDPFDERYQREVGTREAALRAIGETRHIDGDAKTEAERKLRLGATDEHLRGIDRYMLLHGSDEYARGFFKLVNGRSWEMTPAEVAAVRQAQQWDEERGLTLTAANGGALIPTFLDPTVILTNVGTRNAIRQISRNVQILSNTWNGVTSAGITLAWSTEGGDSSDIAPTFQQPSITAYKAHGTVPVTVEAFEDIDGLGAEVARELADARDRFEASTFVSGSGSAQPFGVVTALYTETSRWEQHATNSSMTATDIMDAQNMLGSRYQDRASWLGSLNYHNRVRAFGTDFYGQTREFGQSISDSILGRPAYVASDMSTALNTVTNPAFVYGDFDGYVIADRIGMGVEFIPHLFSTGNGLPNGRRGWYVHYRQGADVVNNTAFVLSVNPGA